MAIIENVSEAARIAGPSEDVSLAELQLAARNHGLPLEALRYDVTPPDCTTCWCTTTSR